MNNYDEIRNLFTEHGLKATMQRIMIYDIICSLRNHPTAEDIFNSVKDKYPGISLSTVYNTLELLVSHCIINTVKTDHGVVKYDAIMDNHHHLYCEKSNKIADYYNIELDELLRNFFSTNNIPNFDVTEVKLQIKGNFIETKEF